MDTGSSMRFIDLLTLLLLWSITGCTATMQNSDKKAILTDITTSCRKEVTQSVQKLTGVKVSEDAFTKYATVVLTNHPRHPYPANDPLVGVVGSEKIVRLIKSDDICKIELLDENGNSLKSIPLHSCRCKSTED